jgi:hypothetical protein
LATAAWSLQCRQVFSDVFEIAPQFIDAWLQRDDRRGWLLRLVFDPGENLLLRVEKTRKPFVTILNLCLQLRHFSWYPVKRVNSNTGGNLFLLVVNHSKLVLLCLKLRLLGLKLRLLRLEVRPHSQYFLGHFGRCCDSCLPNNYVLFLLKPVPA